MDINEVKARLNEEHIFIYALGPRSSSTALQRILNSSNEVCIWGETWGVVGSFAKLLATIQSAMENPKYKHTILGDFALFENAFKQNKHDVFYPNAKRDLSPLLDIFQRNFIEYFLPVNGVKRFGFKEISIQNYPKVLDSLSKTFKKAKFIFLIRPLIPQWKSIQKLKWWSRFPDLESFLTEYADYSECVLSFYSEHKERCWFIESNDLRNPEKIRDLLKFVHVLKFDPELINTTVSTADTANDILAPEEATTVIRSQAYANFLKMRGLIN